MGKKLMKGNEAMGEAAILAGCRHFFGYPITPQSEVSEYLARRMPEVNGCFVQAESEVSAINMVYGAASAGVRVMTGSSGPGISLKQEGISYIAAGDLPCVIGNVQRAGPGLGGIQPSQSEYFQATKGGGHGDYQLLVLAPSSVQETLELTMEAFELADKYRIPAMVLSDGMLGQMMEPVEMPEPLGPPSPKPWATNGAPGRPRNDTTTFFMEGEVIEERNRMAQAKYREIAKNEKRAETFLLDDADLVVTAFGLTARVARQAIQEARKSGLKAGLIRPISLWPFPDFCFRKGLNRARAILCVEINMGQMVQDVRLLVAGRMPVHFYGRIAVTPTPEEIYQAIMDAAVKEGLI